MNYLTEEEFKKLPHCSEQDAIDILIRNVKLLSYWQKDTDKGSNAGGCPHCLHARGYCVRCAWNGKCLKATFGGISYLGQHGVVYGQHISFYKEQEAKSRIFLIAHIEWALALLKPEVAREVIKKARGL